MTTPSSPGSRVASPGRVSLLVQGIVLLALLATNLYWARPYHDWDLLPYVAAALRFGGASPEAAHQEAYRAAREALPPPLYERLTGANGYRRVTAADPEAFSQQLQFYTVKPVYPVLILGLTRAGMSPVDASLAVSRAAYLATGLVLLLWAAAVLAPPAAVATTWGAMSFPFVLDLARLSTPDALSTLTVLSALLLVFHRGRFRAGAGLLLLATAIRPDNVLWLLAVAGYGAVRLDRARSAVAFALAGVALHVALTAWSGNVGWTVLFHHSFVERLAYPESFTASFSPALYVRVLLRETHPANLPPFVLVFAVLGAALLVVRARLHGRRDPVVGLLAVTGLFAGSHWLVFPEGDRFFAAPYLVIVVLLVRTLAVEVRRSRVDEPTPGPAPPALAP